MADAISTSTSDDPKFPLLPLQTPPPNPPFSSPLLTINTLCIISGPLLCLLIYFLVDLGGRHTSRNMLAVLAWIFAWWLTKAVPMAVTSMSPLFLFPMFGIATADEVAKAYMDDIIALVLGSFILALAVEHYNIHRRLALNLWIRRLIYDSLIPFNLSRVRRQIPRSATNMSTM